MVGLQGEGLVVALFSLVHVPLLLESIRQVAVGVREVGLQLYGASVHLNGLVDFPENEKKKNNVVQSLSDKLIHITTYKLKVIGTLQVHDARQVILVTHSVHTCIRIQLDHRFTCEPAKGT